MFLTFLVFVLAIKLVRNVLVRKHRAVFSIGFRYSLALIVNNNYFRRIGIILVRAEMVHTSSYFVSAVLGPEDFVKFIRAFQLY